jgi:phage portal protein BeeE
MSQPLITLSNTGDLRLAKASLQEWIASQRTDASPRDLANLYATSVAAYTVAMRRANAVAGIPFRLMDGNQPVSEDDLLAQVFLQGFGDIIRRSEWTHFFWGHNCLQKRFSRGKTLAGIQWINPHLYNPVIEDSTLTGIDLLERQGGRATKRLTPGSFIYTHGLDFRNDFDGVSPVEVAFLHAGLSVETAQTALSFMQNRAVPVTVFQPAASKNELDPGVDKPQEADAAALTRFLRRTVKGARNAGRSLVQRVRWEIVQLSQALDGANVAAIEEYAEKRVCMAAEYPHVLLGLGGSTYAELYDARRGWYEGWVQERALQYAAWFTEQLVAPINGGWHVEPDFSQVAAMKANIATRTTTVSAQVTGGVLSLYDAQAELGLLADNRFKDLYMIGGVPVPADKIPDLWRTKFGMLDDEQDESTTEDDSSDSEPDEQEAETGTSENPQPDDDATGESDKPDDNDEKQSGPRPEAAKSAGLISDAPILVDESLAENDLPPGTASIDPDDDPSISEMIELAPEPAPTSPTAGQR